MNTNRVESAQSHPDHEVELTIEFHHARDDQPRSLADDDYPDLLIAASSGGLTRRGDAIGTTGVGRREAHHRRRSAAERSARCVGPAVGGGSPDATAGRVVMVRPAFNLLRGLATDGTSVRAPVWPRDSATFPTVTTSIGKRQK